MVVRVHVDNEACIYCLNCLSNCPEEMFTVVGQVIQVRGDGICRNACFECEDFCCGFAITLLIEE